MRIRPRAIIALTLIGIVAGIVGLGFLVKSLTHNSGAKSEPQLQAAATTSQASQLQTPPSREEIRAEVEKWLTDHPDRKGQMRQEDILPGRRFRATAVRFPDNSPMKKLSKETQWSQILIHSDAQDEKWLLKDGHTYKWEVLDKNKNVTESGYFN
ncbi:MAG: hypothetical protein ACREDR_16710 [Blastocatellia bacterium]